MTQKELAFQMGMSPRSLRKVIANVRKKGYPVLAQNGMSLCYNEAMINEEAQTLLDHAKNETAAAASLVQSVHGVPDEDLTPEEKNLLRFLPVIEATNGDFNSAIDFPYQKLG